ncbi:MAG TPA: dihydrofolate reductase [Elainellaceae cyanobacterium]|jgi:dihydrofolate reductase
MSTPKIIIIAAIAEANRVIGDRGTLPWTIPEDLHRFKRLTIGHAVVMGRKTWEFGLNQRSLPNRFNLVVTSSPDEYESIQPTHPNLCFVGSIDEALQRAASFQIIYIIGGASIYNQTIELADELDLTIVEGLFSGDAVFPDWQTRVGDRVQLISNEIHSGFRFETYVKTA